MQPNRRKFFGVAAAALLTAAAAPKAKAQSAGMLITVVRYKGLTVGLFTALTDAETYVSTQAAPASYSIETWPLTPAGQTIPFDGSNF